jgi:membrane protein DedA with SNARE-associated domain
MLSSGIVPYIIHYGYIVILLGTFFEGETILVLAGYLAHRGLLSLPGIAVAAFTGTFAGDQLYFFIGRRRGLAFLDAHPSWKAKAGRVLRMIQSHPNLIALAFRFIYGIRTITPFLLGTSGMAPWRFMALNGVSALAWALAISALGYVLGHTAELVLHDIKRYELMLMGAIIATGILIWTLRFLAEHSRRP